MLHHRFSRLLLIVAILLISPVQSSISAASTFTVNSPDDANDGREPGERDGCGTGRQSLRCRTLAHGDFFDLYELLGFRRIFERYGG